MTQGLCEDRNHFMRLSQALFGTQQTSLMLVQGPQPFTLALFPAEEKVYVDHSVDSGDL